MAEADRERTEPLAGAEAAYADFLRRQGAGEGLDFEAFLKERPEISDALRLLHSMHAGGASPDAGGQAGAEPGARAAGPTLPVPAPGQAPGRPPAGEHDRQDIPEWIGPYKLLELLGEGGMGAVYLAEQREPIRRRVALKLIKLGMDTKEVLARFDAERQTLAMMNHPSIARVFDAGSTEAGRPYFVMEHVPGEPITEYCDRHRLSTRQRLELFMQVCCAVQHAHQKAVIHRDLKPSNVLVMLQDGKPLAKIIDFGLAKATNQHLTERTVFTEQGQIIGTPEYMSPEQAEMGALDIDTRTDIYSLGVLLYELLSGALPFEPSALRKAGYAGIQRIIRDEEPPRPSMRLSGLGPASDAVARKRDTDSGSLLRQLRGDLDWITMKAMEKDRSRRYATAAELAEDLGRHVRNEPVAASPPGASYRLGKFLRKHRGPVAAAVALFVALAAGLAVSLALYLRAEGLRETAEAARLSEEHRSGELRVALEEVTRERNLREEALRDRTEALSQRNGALKRAESLYLSAESEAALATDAGRALLLAIEAAKRHQGSAANNALLAALKVLPEYKALLGHTRSLWAVAFNPDGKRVISGSADGTARIWDAGTGEALFTLEKHKGLIVLVFFSPDGERAVTSSIDDTVRFWSIHDGKKIFTIKGYWAAFSPDGKRVVTRSMDKVVRLWSAEAGEELHALKAHEGTVEVSTFSPDSRRLLTASGDGKAFLWDTETGEKLLGFTGTTVRYSPDGDRILTGGADGVARIWDARTGKEVLTLEGMHPRWSPDGRRVLAVGRGGVVRVWDVETGSEQAVVKALRADFCPDGRRIFASADLKVVGVLDAETGKEVFRFQHESFKPLGSEFGVFSPDGKLLVATWPSETLRVLDASSGKELWVLAGHGKSLQCSAFSPDSSRLATGASDGSLCVWNLQSRRGIQTLVGHKSPVLSAVFDAQGKRVLTGSSDKTARIWNAGTATCAHTLEGHEDIVFGVEFSRDGTRVLTRSRDTTTRVWDSATGAMILKLGGGAKSLLSAGFLGPGDRVYARIENDAIRIWDLAAAKEVFSLKQDGSQVSIEVSSDGRKLATSSDEKNTVVWDGQTGREIFSAQGSDPVLSPDGRRLVTLVREGATRSLDSMRLQFWDTETGQRLSSAKGITAIFREDSTRVLAGLPTGFRVLDAASGEEVCQLSGHGGLVFDARFSPDGKRVVTVSTDRTARIWDAETGKECHVLRAGDADMGDAAFSPDGRWVFTVEKGKAVRVYSSETGEESLTLRGAFDQYRVLFSPDKKSLLTVQEGGPDVTLWPVDPLPAAIQRKPRELTSEEEDLFLGRLSTGRDGSEAEGKRKAGPGQKNRAEQEELLKGLERILFEDGDSEDLGGEGLLKDLGVEGVPEGSKKKQP